MNENVQLKSIIDDIAGKLIKLLSINLISESLNKTINVFYRKGVDHVEKQTDMNLRGNEAKKQLLANYTFENIKDMNEELANKLRKEIQISILNNESIPNIKRRIKSVMDVGEFRASAIARTETNRAENEGRFDAALESPLRLEKWLLVTEDGRTSNICKAMHEKYGSPDKSIPLDENFKVSVKVGKKTVYINQRLPPFHVHERTLVQFKQLPLEE